MTAAPKNDNEKIPVPRFELDEIKTAAAFREAFPVLIQLLTAENSEDGLPVDEDTALSQYQEARKQGYRLFAARSNLEILGVAGLRLCHDPLNSGAPYAILNNLVVEEDFRGLGIGQEIIARIEKLARTEKISVIFLNALKKNKGAKKLYEGLGFEAIADVLMKEV